MSLKDVGKFYVLLYLVIRPLATRRKPNMRDLKNMSLATACAVISGLGCFVGGQIVIPGRPWLSHCLRPIATVPGHLFGLIMPLDVREEIMSVMSAQAYMTGLKLVVSKLNCEIKGLDRCTQIGHLVLLPSGRFASRFLSLL